MKTPAQPIRYVANLAHVREVSLLGTASLEFWRRRLESENLRPAERDGHAQILLVAAQGRFAGLTFRELSISVLVSMEGAPTLDGAYLIQAFNSRRFFAFCERTFFAAPYEFGEVSLVATCPAAVRVVQKGTVVFRAEMHAGASTGREPARCGDDGWEGPVFLPASKPNARRAKLFFARIRGFTRTYPFIPAEDALSIQGLPAGSGLHALVESGFVAIEWVIRENATHAKSKTYRKAQVLAEAPAVPGAVPK